jgi:cobalt-zinc-cadmium efflux system membrane fusion protein
MKSFSKIILMGLFVGLMACGKNQPSEKTETTAAEEATNMVSLTTAQVETAGIELGNIEQRQISGTIKVSGMLDVPPQQMVSVSVPMGGFLKTTSLLQGSRVEKGQTIATVENLDFIQIQQDFLEAKNQLELAQTEYTRQQELAKENVNSTKTLQQAKSQFTNWSIKSKALSEKLKLLNIKSEAIEAGNFSSIITLYSPISGYVTDMNANVGKFANPGDVLFTIVDTEHLHAELTVFEKDFSKIKVGQKIRFSLNNETAERTATVYLIGREIAPDRTVRIHGHLDKEDKNLLPGMYLNAVIETGGVKVNALPSEAIIDFADKKYIFVFDGKTDTVVNYRIVELKTGNREMNFTEITISDTVNLNEWQVVTKGAYALLSKMKNKEEEE